jgi:hypothetical protein
MTAFMNSLQSTSRIGFTLKASLVRELDLILYSEKVIRELMSTFASIYEKDFNVYMQNISNQQSLVFFACIALSVTLIIL